MSVLPALAPPAPLPAIDPELPEAPEEMPEAPDDVPEAPDVSVTLPDPPPPELATLPDAGDVDPVAAPAVEPDAGEPEVKPVEADPDDDVPLSAPVAEVCDEPLATVPSPPPFDPEQAAVRTTDAASGIAKRFPQT